MQVESRILGLLADDSDKTRMFSLKTLSILFTSHVAGISTEFLVKSGAEISDALNDKEPANREEGVRCLGSFLHYCADNTAREEDKRLSDTVSLVLNSLLLHMDDESEGLRDLILGCLITLPVVLQAVLEEKLTRCLSSHRHTEHLHTLLQTVTRVQDGAKYPANETSSSTNV